MSRFTARGMLFHTLVLVLLFFSQPAMAQQVCSASEVGAYRTAQQRNWSCLQQTGGNALYCMGNILALIGVVSESCMAFLNCFNGYGCPGGPSSRVCVTGIGCVGPTGPR